MIALRRIFSDLIFPKSCLSCGQPDNWLCDDCRGKLIIAPEKICPLCKREASNGCCKNDQLAGLYVLSHYHNFPAEKIIKQLKYGFAQDIAGDIISSWLKIFYDRFGESLPPDLIIVPLPLHQRKKLERGFNQAELLAEELESIAGWPLEARLIKRIKYNKQQARLSGDERIANVSGIFKIDERRVSDNWNRPILLVDDVYTTGSTMREAANALKTAGFIEIYGLAVAVN